MIKITNGLNTFIDSSGKLLEVAPKLYEDAIQEPAKETSKTLGLIPKTINAALVPLRQWIAHKEYNMAETEKLLAYKLENLDPKKIVPPEPYVAVPAIQAISYSKDNEQLRNLYANLLSKSMNVDTKDNVHPSFVEIIKQLSPLDAKLLKNLFYAQKDPIPKLKLSLQASENDFNHIDVWRTVLHPNCYTDLSLIESYLISLDNLERLKLIIINDDSYLNPPQLYTEIESSIDKEYFSKLRSDLPYVNLQKGFISLSDFGKKFISIVF
ncbi:DUF4393 domain-containing protein [Clostridium sp.]|uniref:DUF4393 domain-containing protein n=1 Tax=Clostridium sp. TaxID=1506 RepID=UPI0025BD3D8A|nr:DUF4393 domain-containing protein [Clostridium sp.]